MLEFTLSCIVTDLGNWSYFYSSNYISKQEVEISYAENSSYFPISIQGYTDLDFLGQTRRYSLCEGTETQEPNWTSRVSSLYDNEGIVSFYYLPGIYIRPLGWRRHYVEWISDQYLEGHIRNGYTLTLT